MSRVESAFASEAKLRWALAGLDEDHAPTEENEYQIELRSSWPLPHDLVHEKVGSGPPWVLLAAFFGALVGGLTAYAVGAGTASVYPLPTGGMPIVAGPPLGIITYEGTALGLILATVMAVVWRGRLYRHSKSSPFDRHLADGAILLTVIDADEPELVESILRNAGALDVRRS